MRRNKFEIVNILLNLIKNGNKLGMPITRLLQMSNLSPQGFKEYYPRILNLKLIREVESGKNRKKVFLTELGKDYVKKSNLIIASLEKLNKEYKLNLEEIRYK